MRYVGRFAPSPTGPLHIGSLLTAAASYLDARRHSAGEWLVRIEDIDPPREAPGAADAILRALERLDLEWDREVLYQSSRIPVYRDVAAELRRSGLVYACSCTRSMLRGVEGESPASRYPGTCRAKTRHRRATALRMRAPSEPVRFDDRLQGPQRHDIDAQTGDYVIFRRDGLPAYHLAVVVDDAQQGVTHIVRGMDLLTCTAAHIHLQHALSLPRPSYCHLPVIVNAAGQKLSKQTGAAALALDTPGCLALEILRYLRMAPPRELHGAPPRELWTWARAQWRPGLLAGIRTLALREAVAVEPPMG